MSGNSQKKHLRKLSDFSPGFMIFLAFLLINFNSFLLIDWLNELGSKHTSFLICLSITLNFSKFYVWPQLKDFQEFFFRKAIKSALSWMFLVPYQVILIPGMYFWGCLKKLNKCSSLHLKFALANEALDWNAVEPVFLPKSLPSFGASESPS